MNDLYQQNLLAVMQLNAMRAYVRALESLQVETMIPTLAAERGRAVMAEMQTRAGELDASIESFLKLPVARADKDKLEQARKELMAAREGRKAYNVPACQDTKLKNLSYILLPFLSAYAAIRYC